MGWLARLCCGAESVGQLRSADAADLFPDQDHSTLSDRPRVYDTALPQDVEPQPGRVTRQGTNESTRSFRRTLSLRSISRSPTYPSLRQLPSSPSELAMPIQGDPLVRLTPKCMDKEMILPNTKSCFYPVSILDELIREEVVSKILKNTGVEDRNGRLTRFVCNKAKRVFAILLSCEQVSLITRFFDNSFTDQMLPVGPGILSGSEEMESFTTKLANLRIVKNTFHDDLWPYRDLQYFHRDRQWLFIIPIFDDSTFRYSFHEQCHMPFMERDPLVSNDTLFSTVEKRRIHKDHLRISPTIGIKASLDEHPYIAVKHIKKGSLDWDQYREVADEEADTLRMLREDSRKHIHLLRAIAYYSLGKNNYILSPWAGFGNLREFWEQDVVDPARRTLNPRFFEWMFTQLCGLAEAVQKLHNVPGSEENWRHGDLKPENILCFENIGSLPPERYLPCILVIADVGLTRQHTTATENRQDPTRAKAGTFMYEPPETELDQDQKKGRSRRYDIWSMGCIYLEFIIWLLYGSRELKRLARDLGENKRFYEFDSSKKPRLHHVIKAWTDHIKNDPRCPANTALRWLLDLVLDRLLNPTMGSVSTKQRVGTMLLHRVTTLREPGDRGAPAPNVILRTPTVQSPSPNTSDPSLDGRVSADEMNDELQEIYRRATATDSSKLEWMQFVDSPQQGPDKILYKSRLTELDARRSSSNIPGNKEEYRFTPLDDKWEYGPDTDTAQALSIRIDEMFPASDANHAGPLCVRCKHLDLWRPRRDFSDTLAGLRKKSAYCTLCLILFLRLHKYVSNESIGLEFSRNGSSVGCSALANQPVASLYTIPAFQESLPGLQVGLPQLSESGSQLNIEIILEWISSCNQLHRCLPKNDVFLPTRVLDVGSATSTTIRLICFNREHTTCGKYLALSHRWGSSLTNKMFRTLKSNLEEFKCAIAIADLPRTFQQAVQITRKLGLRYIWIDSLCIVQDDPEDWDHESGLMEKVFSSAYATIAATSAAGTNDGFLKPRPKRHCVTMHKDAIPYYVCDAIDNFHEDVDQAELNQRGWVLQERALSRRTIHFTEKQCYWECGEGVRCETLTRMKNRKASFLGDADFPRSVEIYVKGMKIELYQDLYSKYSNLALSFNADRPIAIRGLEKRLLHTLDTKGGYGIFQIYLHRCLLWQRHSNPLTKIGSFHGETVPSWSWMAYAGRIKYMGVPYGKVEWVGDIELVFASPGGSCHTHLDLPVQLEAPVFDLVDQKKEGIAFDQAGDFSERLLQCVIVGFSVDIQQGEPPLCYVVVVLRGGTLRPSVYERVGAACLSRDRISIEPSDKRASIL